MLRERKIVLLWTKKMTKQTIGEMDYRYDSGNKIVVIRWDGSTQVTVASNAHVVNPV